MQMAQKLWPSTMIYESRLMKNVKYRMKCRLVATATTTHQVKHTRCFRMNIFRMNILSRFEFDSEL